jgi:transposase
MVQGSELTVEERKSIITMHSSGVDVKTIAKSLNRSLSVCYNIIKSGSIERKQSKRGKSSKITKRMRRQVARLVSKEGLSARQVKDRLQCDYSIRTIQRTISGIDWLKYIKRTAAPNLSKRHKEERKKWASEMAMFDNEDWSKVIFSDEKKWNLDGPDGMRYQWVDTRHPIPTNLRRHSGGGGVMIWAAFCEGKKSGLKFLDGRQGSADYVSTLESHLIPFIDVENEIFQQDNAPIHTSGVTMEWFRSKNINVMPWPALSPDLNPIENVWGMMTQQVYRNGTQYQSIHSLKQAILKAWDSIDPNILKKLSHGMKKRCIKVIENGGAYISY